MCKQQLQGNEVSVLISNLGSKDCNTYIYDGIDVHQYAEHSIINRSLTTGVVLPVGLKNLTSYLADQKPDIVHFHEIAGSINIGIVHLENAKKTGAKIVNKIG